MTRLCPRIRYHKDGTASLHGIPADDLFSILTAARLYRYDCDKKEPADKLLAGAMGKAEKYHAEGNIMMRNVVLENWLEGEMWRERQAKTLDLTDKLHDMKRRETFNYAMRPLHTLDPWQIKQRRQDAESARKFRKHMSNFMASDLLSGVKP